MRWLLGGLVFLALAGAALVIGGPHLIPQEWLRQQVASELAAATGRPVAITGETSVQLVPYPAARLGGLEIAGAAGFEGPPLVRADAISVDLALFPLLGSAIEVRRLVVEGLDVRLQIDPTGRANWSVDATGESSPSPATEEPSAPAGAPEATVARPTGGQPTPAVSLGDVRLIGGHISLDDRQTGSQRVFENVEGNVTMKALAEPLSVALTGQLDGRALALNLALDTPADVVAGREVSVTATADSAGTRATLDGTLTAGDARGLRGALDVRVQEVGATASWLAGTDIDAPVTTLNLTGQLEVEPQRLALSALRLEADDLSGEGDLVLDGSGDRPLLRGSLALGEIDLAAFERAESATPAPEADPTAGETPERPKGDRERDPEASKPEKAATEADIRLAPVPLDLDVAVNFEGLRAPPLTFGAGTAHLGGSDGELALAVGSLELYGGTAAGTVKLAPHDVGIVVTPDVTLRGIETGPLLRDLANVGNLDGKADVSFTGEARGGNEAELLASLDGSGRLAIARAVLTGLAGHPELEQLRTLLMLGGEAGAPIRLADITATFDVADGIVRNDDLSAATPALQISGAGSVDLPGERVPSYRLTPSPSGLLGTIQELQVLSVPVVIEGPFDSLRVRYEPPAAARVPLKDAAEALEEAREQLEQGDVEGAAETVIQKGLGGLLRGLGIDP